MNLIQKTICAGLLALGAASPLMAQEEVPRVALYTDWSVFNPTDPQECFIASAPTQTAARRGGESVDVRRDAIRLYVASRPGEGTKNEIAFTGNETFELFTEGEFAWPASPAEDQKIIVSMQRGANAVVTGVSSRGTTTIDTFSLIGFSDALSDSNARCQ